MREIRQSQVLEVRETDTGGHEADIRIVTYGPVDTYGTSWAPDVFARSVAEGPITAVWAHDSHRPIGVVGNFRTSDGALDGTLEYLDFDSCPDAKLAYQAMKKKAYRDVSFAFERVSERPDPNVRTATQITDADLIEISPVLRGSVPGSRVLAVRSEDETVSKKVAADLFVKFSTGEIDLADALWTLKGTGEGAPPVDPTEIETQPGDPEDTPEPVTLEPDPDEDSILEKLDSLARSKASKKPYGG